MTPALSREIRVLETIADRLQGTDSLEVALDEVVHAVVRWSGADRATLIQFNQEQREVLHFLRAGPGWAEVQTAVGFDELQAGLSGWALRTGEVANSPKSPPDAREGPEVQARRVATRCGAIMVAPVGPAANRLGTITVIRREDEADFDAQEAAEFGILAGLAGWVIRLAVEQDRSSRAALETKAAVKSKMNFLSNLSHELRTPLNGVMGFAHLLDASSLDPSQKNMVQTILSSGNRLLGTVDNLLELAQHETGQFHLEATPFSPQSVLDSVIAKYRDQARERGLDWHISVDKAVPAVFEGDPVRLGQAWGHVVSNAVKFTETGTITVHLESRKTSRGRAELILNVHDTGVGLSNDRSGQWFMPFHQEDGSLTRKFGGTGLGLALCDRIVRKMGGGISLLSEAGVGTKVRIWVDLDHEKTSRMLAHQGLRVLLQDHDSISGLVVVKLLEKAGNRVDFVSTLEQARSRLENSDYEVLLFEAPPPDENAVSQLSVSSFGAGLALVGVFGVGQGPSPESQIPWTAILHKPVTYSTLQAALSRCRPKGEA